MFPYPLKCGLLKPGHLVMGNFFKSKFPYLLKCRLPKQGNGSVKLSSKVSIPTQMWASETQMVMITRESKQVSIPTQMWASETITQTVQVLLYKEFPYPLKCRRETVANLRNFRQNLQGFKINLTFVIKPINQRLCR